MRYGTQKGSGASRTPRSWLPSPGCSPAKRAAEAAESQSIEAGRQTWRALAVPAPPLTPTSTGMSTAKSKSKGLSTTTGTAATRTGQGDDRKRRSSCGRDQAPSFKAPSTRLVQVTPMAAAPAQCGGRRPLMQPLGLGKAIAIDPSILPKQIAPASRWVGLQAQVTSEAEARPPCWWHCTTKQPGLCIRPTRGTEGVTDVHGVVSCGCSVDAERMTC